MPDLKLIDWKLIINILEQLGSIMNLSQFCNEFLVTIRPLIPFENGHFIFYDQDQELLPVSYRYNITEKTHNCYLNYYRQIDDFMKNALNTPEPKRSTDIMNYKQWQQTEYFNDFHLKNNFYYIAISDIHYQGRLLSSISLIRNKRSSDFSMRELLYLKMLSPHIGNLIYKLQVIEKKNKTNKDIIFTQISRKQKFFQFTNRENDVIDYVIKGKSNTEISDLLYISPETVKKHLNSVFKKANVKNRTELIATFLDLI